MLKTAPVGGTKKIWRRWQNDDIPPLIVAKWCAIYDFQLLRSVYQLTMIADGNSFNVI